MATKTTNRPDKITEAMKMPPHSQEAEQSVLGGLMLDNNAWDKVVERVSEKDFYRHEHRLIFRAMTRLVASHKPFDVITLSENLATVNQLEESGGLPFLVSLAKNTPSSANVGAYADIVRERSILRQLITISSEISESAFNTEGRPSADILDDAESKIFQIAEQNSRGQGPQDIKSLLAKAVERINELFKSESTITGSRTGFDDFDQLTAGLQPADLIVVAGRPSMGKTLLSINIAENVALDSKKPVLIFSLEMPAEQLVMRMLSSLGRIEQTTMRTGKLAEQDWPRLTSAVSVLTEANIHIDDTPGISPAEIRARARRVAREHGEIGLVVVDYLQLMHVPGTRENRTTEISEISRSLKLLAKELNSPVIAISQLNRELEHRPNKRPMMSDLRESGAIEQDADLIAFIYRDEVYNKESTDNKGIAEVIIAKQRNGPIDTVRLAFLGQYCKFENLARDIYD